MNANAETWLIRVGVNVNADTWLILVGNGACKHQQVNHWKQAWGAYPTYAFERLVTHAGNALLREAAGRMPRTLFLNRETSMGSIERVSDSPCWQVRDTPCTTRITSLTPRHAPRLLLATRLATPVATPLGGVGVNVNADMPIATVSPRRVVPQRLP